MKRRSFLMVWVGAVSLCLMVQEPLSGQVGLQEVTNLRFRGNHQFPNEALANAIITRETECRSFLFRVIPFCLVGADFSLDPYFFNEREFERDQARVRLFYWLRGFRETVVDTVLIRPTEDEVQITFEIQEGEPIQVVEVSFLGLEELSDSSVLEDLPIRVGEPLSLVTLDATRDTLETRLRNRGFAHVDVLRNYDIPRETPHEAQVTFDVYPGPLARFGQLTVVVRGTQGRTPTMEESAVRRMLPFQEGDEYEEDLLFSGQRGLYNLDIVRGVTFTRDSVSKEDPVLPYAITVEEGDVHRVRAGGGLSTAECINLEARWSNLNFLGGARRLQVTGRVSNLLAHKLQNTPQSFPLCKDAGEGKYGDRTGSISLDFTQPWLFSPRNSISAALFYELQSVDQVFTREALGMNLGLSRTLGVSALLGFSFRPQRSKLGAAEVFFCSAYLICEKSEIELFQDRARILSPVGISFSLDRRNQALSPTRGYSAAVDLEYAGDWTGSEFRYTRVVSEATWHKENRSRWVLGARLRGGWVTPGGFLGLGQGRSSSEIVHPEKRLFAGGSNSVRGYGQNRLGPRVLYVEKAVDLLWEKWPTKQGEDPKRICSYEELMDRSCDAGGLPDNLFLVQPRGGTKLLEGSLEFRFPVSGRLWEGATFLDFGQVWDEEASLSLANLVADLRFTPGLGIRYLSPIGPIRVDLAYRFGGGEPLSVLTQAIVPYDPNSGQELVPGPLGPNGERYGFSGDLVVLDPPVYWREGLPALSLRRLQLHFSIGQAF